MIEFINDLKDGIVKYKKSIFGVICFTAFLWVFINFIIDIQGNFFTREGLKCDGRMPHEIKEINNSKGIQIKENFWHSDED